MKEIEDLKDERLGNSKQYKIQMFLDILTSMKNILY